MNELQKELKDLMITANGGDFFGDKVTPDDVSILNHNLGGMLGDLDIKLHVEEFENFEKSDPIVVVKLAIEEAIKYNTDEVATSLQQMLTLLDDVTIIADYIDTAKEEEISLRNN